MAVSQYPPKTSGGTEGYILNAATSKTTYKVSLPLTAGSYLVTCPSDVIASVGFVASNGGHAGSGTTSNGSIPILVNSDVSEVTYWTSAKDNVAISIQKTGSLVDASSSASGSLETISTSGTYTPPAAGTARICAIGGGGGGRSGVAAAYGTNTYGLGGGGGGGGRAAIGSFYLDGSGISVTLGAGGPGNGAGGTTTFGSLLTAPGGSAGSLPTGGNGGSAGGNGGYSGAAGIKGAADGATIDSGGVSSGVSVAEFVTSTGGNGGSGGNGGGGGGGGPYGGGGGGGGNSQGINIYVGGGGGGGGGGVAGGNGGGSGPAGVGGAGRVFILRWET